MCYSLSFTGIGEGSVSLEGGGGLPFLLTKLEELVLRPVDRVGHLGEVVAEGRHGEREAVLRHLGGSLAHTLGANIDVEAVRVIFSGVSP